MSGRKLCIFLAEPVDNLLSELQRSTGKSIGAIVKLAIVLLHYLITKASEGYEIQLVNRDKNETILMPTGLVVDRNPDIEPTQPSSEE